MNEIPEPCWKCNVDSAVNWCGLCAPCNELFQANMESTPQYFCSACERVMPVGRYSICEECEPLENDRKQWGKRLDSSYLRRIAVATEGILKHLEKSTNATGEFK